MRVERRGRKVVLSSVTDRFGSGFSCTGGVEGFTGKDYSGCSSNGLFHFVLACTCLHVCVHSF